MKHFMLDEQYFTSVIVHTEHKRFGDRTELTQDELLELIKRGPLSGSSMTSKDHPEFAKLREQLGAEGYITIQRGWSNGDIVLKSFTLNDMKFKKDEQFSCAAAMQFYNERATEKKQRKMT